MVETRLLSASELLQNMLEVHKDQEHVTFAEMVAAFKEGSFALLLIIFSSPTALPLPALPGLTFILSLPVLFLSLQLAVGKRSPWIPQWLGKKKMRRKTLKAIVEKVCHYLHKTEKVLKPRFVFLSSRSGEKFIGLFALLCAISVSLPFPLTSTIPSIGIVIMSIGLLERDGLVITAGMCVGAVGITVAFSVYYFGVEAIKALF